MAEKVFYYLLALNLAAGFFLVYGIIVTQLRSRRERRERAKGFRIIQSSRRGYRPYGRSDWIAAIKKVFRREGKVSAGYLQDKYPYLYQQGVWIFGVWDEALSAVGPIPEGTCQEYSTQKNSFRLGFTGSTLRAVIKAVGHYGEVIPLSRAANKSKIRVRSFVALRICAPYDISYVMPVVCQQSPY